MERDEKEKERNRQKNKERKIENGRRYRGKKRKRNTVEEICLGVFIRVVSAVIIAIASILGGNALLRVQAPDHVLLTRLLQRDSLHENLHIFPYHDLRKR